MTRELQLTRWLFEAKSAINGRTNIRPETIRNGLCHCLGANNEAVAKEAARLMSERVVHVVIA